MTLIKSYQLVSKTEEIMPGNLKITTVYNCFIEKYPCHHLKEDFCRNIFDRDLHLTLTVRDT